MVKEVKYCNADGCERLSKIKGLCEKHYNRLNRTGKLYLKREEKTLEIIKGNGSTLDKIRAIKQLALELRHAETLEQEIVESPKIKLCEADGCERQAKTKGLCDKHYNRLLKTGKVTLPIDNKVFEPKKPKQTYGKYCNADGCERLSETKGYCGKHYNRLKRTGKITLKGELKNIEGIPTCKAKGCSTSSVRDGYCFKHYVELNNSLAKSIKEDETDSTENNGFEESTNTAFITPTGKVYQQGRTLDVDSEEFKEKQEGFVYPVCSVIECTTRVGGKGVCQKHLTQFRKDGKIKELKNKTCKAPNCNKDSKSRGYCSKHYAQILKYGRLTPELEINSRGVCSVEDCDKPHQAKGYCINHYSQLKRGNIPQPKPIYPKTCIADGCEKDSVTKGYCTAHRRHIVKYGEIRPDIKSELVDCKVVGCNNKRTSLGYCGMHYKQVKTHGKVVRVHRKELIDRTGICKVEGCETPHKTRGYCNTHYYSLKNKGLLDNLEVGHDHEPCEIKEPIRGVDICKEHDCNFKVYKDELCVEHYYKLKEDMKKLEDQASYWEDEEDFVEV